MTPFSKMAGELVKKDLHFSISSCILVPLGNNMEDKKKLQFSGLEIFWSIKAYVHQSMS